MALKSDGTLWAWGENSSGSLGNGTYFSQNAPVKTGAGSNWVSVAAGDGHTLALRSDGTLWAWGYNGSGQLGDGTLMAKKVPTRVILDWRKLSVTKVGSGTGRVSSTSIPAVINCGSSCSAGFPVNSTVTLTAWPDAIAEFAGWSGGGCSGTNPSCTVTMSADWTVTATFSVGSDIYGQWVYTSDHESCSDCGWDTCDGDQFSAFTCSSGVALSCTDTADFVHYDDELEWRYRNVICN